MGAKYSWQLFIIYLEFVSKILIIIFAAGNSMLQFTRQVSTAYRLQYTACSGTHNSNAGNAGEQSGNWSSLPLRPEKFFEIVYATFCNPVHFRPENCSQSRP